MATVDFGPIDKLVPEQPVRRGPGRPPRKWVTERSEEAPMQTETPDPTTNGEVHSGRERIDVAAIKDAKERVDAAAEAIRWCVVDYAQPTRVEIRHFVTKQMGFTTEDYQRGFARIHNQLKLITEVTREDGSKGYELRRREFADLSVQAIAELQNSGKKKETERFGQWYEVNGEITLESPALASRPVVGNQAARAFLRDFSRKNILLLNSYFGSMGRIAAKAPGAPTIGNAIYQIRWDQQTFPVDELGKELNPVPPSRPGMSGQGITEVESIPTGKVIPFCALVPGTHISPYAFAQLMVVAGRFVGFSPSGAHKGWGRFSPKIEWDPAWGDQKEIRLALENSVSDDGENGNDTEDTPAENGESDD